MHSMQTSRLVTRSRVRLSSSLTTVHSQHLRASSRTSNCFHINNLRSGISGPLFYIVSCRKSVRGVLLMGPTDSFSATIIADFFSDAKKAQRPIQIIQNVTFFHKYPPLILPQSSLRARFCKITAYIFGTRLILRNFAGEF